MNCHTGFERCLCSLGWMFLCTGPKNRSTWIAPGVLQKAAQTLHGLFAILSGTYDSGAVREYVVFEPGWWQWDSQWPVCVAFLFPFVSKPCVLNHWLTCCKAVLSLCCRHVVAVVVAAMGISIVADADAAGFDGRLLIPSASLLPPSKVHPLCAEQTFVHSHVGRGNRGSTVEAGNHGRVARSWSTTCLSSLPSPETSF